MTMMAITVMNFLIPTPSEAIQHESVQSDAKNSCGGIYTKHMGAPGIKSSTSAETPMDSVETNESTSPALALVTFAKTYPFFQYNEMDKDGAYTETLRKVRIGTSLKTESNPLLVV
jgi:hypothetical protein